MDSNRKKARGLGLCSGGLDSMLSAMVLREQGVHVEWITFETPFFSADNSRKASAMLDVPLTVENITPRYLEMLKNPNCGYGRCMNPCLDCHALMFHLAGRHMALEGFHFLFSGEVLGQRPMSQKRGSLRYVEKHSGYEGLILRPLSAGALTETIPEKEGFVDRDRLLSITGRSRKAQLQLAEKFGISDFPAPAGGCLLTDVGFSKRLRDLFDHCDVPSEREMHLLKHGRHMRLDSKTKVIVGRTRQDNADIRGLFDPGSDAVLHVVGFPGPTVLVPEGWCRESLLSAAAICAGYSKAPNDRPARVKIVSPDGESVVAVQPLSAKEAAGLLI